MIERANTRPIIDIRLLASQLDLDPEHTQIICRRLFWAIAEGQGPFAQELKAVVQGTGSAPSTARALAELLARDMRAPIPPAKESLGMRASEFPEDAREKVSELKGRVTSSVASIDVGSLREDGAKKVVQLRNRAADVDVSEVTDQAKALGHKAASGVKDLVGRFRNRFKGSKTKQTVSDHEV